MSAVGWAPFPDFSLITQVNSKELAALEGPVCREALAAAALHRVCFAAPVTVTQLTHTGRQKLAICTYRKGRVKSQGEGRQNLVPV